MSILDDYPDLQQYKRIHHRSHKRTDKLLVTIYKHSGSINLSEASYIALGCPNYLVLYYSTGKHTLLIQKVSQSDSGALKIARRGRTATYYINVKQLCRQIGIDLTQSHHYVTELQDGVLVVDLSREEHGTN